MFSQVSVCPVACMVGGMYGGGHVWQGGIHGRGVCVAWGACVPGETATAVGGTHPTGTHSC